jgi:preprotein translocase subunit SecD
VVIIALYATMAGIGRWTPKLGIDLAGGTSVTLTATTTNGTAVTSSAVTQARNIIQNRVDGLGVSGAQVSQQGSNNIVVQIPGNNNQNIANQLGQTAALTFRQVETEAAAAPTSTTTSPTSTATSTGTKTSTATTSTTKASTSTTTTQKDVLSNGLKAASSASPSSTTTSTATSTASPSSTATSTSTASASCSFSKVPTSVTASQTCAQTLYTAMTCTSTQAAAFNNWKPTYYVPACSNDRSTKYILGPSSVDGKDVSSVTATPQTSGSGSNQFLTGSWEIDLTFNAKGTSDFGKITTTLAALSPPGALAIVLDGIVESAPSISSGAITTGNAQITGNFSETQANDIANVLKYGQLPLAFNQSDVSQVSASLAGTQLTGGLLAGAIGLALVFLYLVLYYRGLAFIAISSLFISASLTYALAVLLGPLIGFTLDLPGIAGLIVAIGINADSFVVFFERLRDEVREGRTLRTAVQRGWERARRTILSADFITFLAAAVLYEVSVGSVKGFAFTLGLTTVLDVFVVFLFTKPLVTLVARTNFFGNGHRWSGLDPSRLGVRRAAGRVPIVARRGKPGTGTTDPTVEG